MGSLNTLQAEHHESSFPFEIGVSAFPSLSSQTRPVPIKHSRDASLASNKLMPSVVLALVRRVLIFPADSAALLFPVEQAFFQFSVDFAAAGVVDVVLGAHCNCEVNERG